MTGLWWPEGAPVPPQRIGELTSRELRTLLEFANAAPDDGPRMDEWRLALVAEADERRQLAEWITEGAKAGRPGPL